jgi:hypothetical protein
MSIDCPRENIPIDQGLLWRAFQVWLCVTLAQLAAVFSRVAVVAVVAAMYHSERSLTGTLKERQPKNIAEPTWLQDCHDEPRRSAPPRRRPESKLKKNNLVPGGEHRRDSAREDVFN